MEDVTRPFCSQVVAAWVPANSNTLTRESCHVRLRCGRAGFGNRPILFAGKRRAEERNTFYMSRLLAQPSGVRKTGRRQRASAPREEHRSSAALQQSRTESIEPFGPSCSGNPRGGTKRSAAEAGRTNVRWETLARVVPEVLGPHLMSRTVDDVSQLWRYARI